MPKTVSEQIADQLRSEILAGLIPPGTRLLQDVEAARLQVSRTPLREAFRQLEAERLVQIVPNRGAIVTQLTAEEVGEIFLIRGELEPLAAARAAREASPEDLRAIGALLGELEYARERERNRSLLELNKSFHFMVYESSGLPRLVNIISSLWGPIEAMRAAYASEPVTARHAADEHARLYEAIKDRDEERAAAVTRRHVETMTAALLGWMEGASSPIGSSPSARAAKAGSASRGGERESPDGGEPGTGPVKDPEGTESSG
jgi:DNA-binding GntR family transcriptional regulator